MQVMSFFVSISCQISWKLNQTTNLWHIWCKTIPHAACCCCCNALSALYISIWIPLVFNLQLSLFTLCHYFKWPSHATRLIMAFLFLSFFLFSLSFFFWEQFILAFIWEYLIHHTIGKLFLGNVLTDYCCLPFSLFVLI